MRISSAQCLLCLFKLFKKAIFMPNDQNTIKTTVGLRWLRVLIFYLTYSSLAQLYYSSIDVPNVVFKARQHLVDNAAVVVVGRAGRRYDLVYVPYAVGLRQWR
ncbi:hypothetical protein T02_12115 [Trichinella nativa]|uniref:Uncharacterized protein n=1 Tax=Trichinella nativa TaxID=6335 RepID=A0A0V1KS04_9BILA|nr:hypothetical protein T02_12115 [Trichinella nativa]